MVLLILAYLEVPEFKLNNYYNNASKVCKI